MENSTLTLADLASMKTILEAACQRGAFRANEMSTVGILYDKLNRFIEGTVPPAPEQMATEPQAESQTVLQGEKNA